MSRLISSGLTLFLLLHFSAVAQLTAADEEFDLGRTVALTTDGYRLEGSVVFRTEQLQLQRVDQAPITIPFNQVHRLELREEKKVTVKGQPVNAAFYALTPVSGGPEQLGFISQERMVYFRMDSDRGVKNMALAGQHGEEDDLQREQASGSDPGRAGTGPCRPEAGGGPGRHALAAHRDHGGGRRADPLQCFGERSTGARSARRNSAVRTAWAIPAGRSGRCRITTSACSSPAWGRNRSGISVSAPDGHFQALAAGELELGINDDEPRDNSGNFTVLVEVILGERWSPFLTADLTIFAIPPLEVCGPEDPHAWLCLCGGNSVESILH